MFGSVMSPSSVYLLVLLSTASCINPQLQERDYVAAAFEHEPSVPLFTMSPLEVWKTNLDVFEEQTKLAAQKGADIILFPEFGTTIVNPDMWAAMETLLPYLHNCPDPKVDPDWIPCEHPTKYERIYPLYRLSCMARDNHVWVGSGTFSTNPCETTDPTCPENGRFIRNTAVFFDRAGRLAFRYVKTHLFFEPVANSRLKQCDEDDLPIFETEFARFGVAICYDSTFNCPTRRLAEKAGVRNILFPTFWVDFALGPALLWQQGVAAGLGINLIASNMNEEFTTGSGIYSGREVLDYTYKGLKPLLIAKVPNPPVSKCGQDTTTGGHQYKESPNVPEADDSFAAWTEMFGKQMKFAELKHGEGSISVCDGELCCYLTYSRTAKDEEIYVLGAASGQGYLNETDHFRTSNRGLQHKLFVQICVLLKCPNSDLSKCGTFPERASTTFQHIEVFGNFSSSYLYPGILTSGHAFAEMGEWDYNRGRLWSENGVSRPLVAARLMGRNFEKDDIDPRQQ